MQIGERYYCIIDRNSKCNYSLLNVDLGNFIRHCREMHTTAAVAKGLFKAKSKEEEKLLIEKIEMKKLKTPETLRVHAKGGVEICGKAFIKNILKMVVQHRLPLDCFEWDTFRSILDVLAKPWDIDINASSITSAISLMAERIATGLRLELQHKLVSILIESTARHGQHYLVLSAQFEQDRLIQTRFLGAIQVHSHETIEQLHSSIFEILERYALEHGQIYGIVVENGTDMFLLRGKLPKAFEKTVNLEIGADSDGTDLARLEELLESLTTLLRNQFTVLRGPLRHLHLALNAILPETDPSISRILKFAHALHDSRLRQLFAANGASYPGTNTAYRWPAKYHMIRTISRQKQFLTQLVQDHPELGMTIPYCSNSMNLTLSPLP